ncbi:ATP-dependent RecD-like DNA helicase [Pseudoflavonifractor sp. MSJ-30]|uniref:SF1B family DNA helicase RecD2 n=1 Tax=Pseudoflavonifractor sp. MSJ-30 TaxID=2841525 RepID=UPI001C128EDC|nr:ATP-dependent RecD-like DNA helicase [Pseudoflavonifractor sp. MSJ-30]MBU5452876.1 ATP-dependent RecD-like DNA helicase [Pseudoflavonifractor sp. MSJ-30]
MTQELEIIQGTIEAVVYQNYDNGYSVLRLNVGEKQAVTVVGTIPLPVVGERLMVTGKWSSHSNYGRQFEAEFLERLMPETAAQIQAYLAGRVIKGIGPVSAARIVAKFGDRTLQIMEREPLRLAEVSGISEARAKAIGEEFRVRVGMRQLMEFFAQHQLPAELALRAYKLFGESTVDLLYDDPYLLMEEGLDAPFAAVDRFAIELGVSGDDPRRVEAGILFQLEYNLTVGHSFLPEKKLVDSTAQLLSLDAETILSGMERLLEGGRMVRGTLADITVDYLPDLYEAEVYSTARLLELGKKAFPEPDDLDGMIEDISRESGIAYSEEQTQAIREAATSGLLLITGGPGTGKTTLLTGILELFGKMQLRCLVAAPTGRAAKRMSEVTGEEASTIHRLLEAGIDQNTGKMYFARDAENPLKADAVIVDEMSMVDVRLLCSLLKAIPKGKRLILVGDPDQLPPVGPGSPFSDMLRSGVLPTVRLTEIFRQAQQSLIVMNAHRINRGEMPDLKNVKSDFFFMRRNSEEELTNLIRDLCTTRLPRNMGIPPEQIQVLSPTRKGGVGTVALNKMLQGALNPASSDKREHQYGNTCFREGDRVMQVRNNYDIVWKKTDGSAAGTGIFNGDVGIVREIDRDRESVKVVYDDREAEYDFTQLGELEPAFAITVHKSQGSEYRAVILTAWGGSPYLLSRSVLYTAITRARELLIIVGREETIAAMTANAVKNKRYTGLKLRLQGKAQ